jgi:hypothetical protein
MIKLRDFISVLAAECSVLSQVFASLTLDSALGIHFAGLDDDYCLPAMFENWNN